MNVALPLCCIFSSVFHGLTVTSSKASSSPAYVFRASAENTQSTPSRTIDSMSSEQRIEILSTTSWFISIKHQILTNNLKGNIRHEVGRIDKQTSALFLSACSSSSCHASNNTCSYSSHTTTPSILRKKG